MKFKIENNWLLRTEEDIELNPKDFVHCATIEELNGLSTAECLGKYFWDTTYGNFMLEWQKLKGLPEEL